MIQGTVVSIERQDTHRSRGDYQVFVTLEMSEKDRRFFSPNPVRVTFPIPGNERIPQIGSVYTLTLGN